MIGNYVPARFRRDSPATAPNIEPFRQELRRGCLALAALAELRSETYGYTLRQSLMDAGLSVEQGTLYPLLKRLETQGFLASEWRREGRRQKRFYRLTAAGRQLLELLESEWRALAETVGGVIEGPRSKVA